MQYYNVHTHTYTERNAPVDFLKLYLPSAIADLINRITSTKAGAAVVEKILSMAPGPGIKRYASFLKIGKSISQLEVFEGLMKQYTDDNNIKFVVLTMYMEACGAGASLSGYEGQLEQLLEVKRKYPDRLLIFLGVDPRWNNQGASLHQTVAQYFERKLVINATRSVYPFAGLKIYPSTGFYAFDARLKPTFEWAAKNGVPIISHCSYLGGIYNNDAQYLSSGLQGDDPYAGARYPGNPISYRDKRNWLRWIIGTNNSYNNRNKCSWFMEPAGYSSMLEYFENKGTPLKLCLAHYGSAQQIGQLENETAAVPYGQMKKNWTRQINEMMGKYSQLYTDISYTLSDPHTHNFILKQLDDPVYRNRIMYGTDYFLTEREMPEQKDYSDFKKKAVEKIINGQSAWDWVAGTNTDTFLKSRFTQNDDTPTI